jgi:hypothetical protein
VRGASASYEDVEELMIGEHPGPETRTLGSEGDHADGVGETPEKQQPYRRPAEPLGQWRQQEHPEPALGDLKGD